jgi:hypothetical protein
MRQRINGGKIIAIDVACPAEMVGSVPSAAGLSGWPLLIGKMFKNDKPVMPNIAEIIYESIVLCSHSLSREMLQDADYSITIDASHWPAFDFGIAEPMMQLGYEQTMKAFKEVTFV